MPKGEATGLDLSDTVLDKARQAAKEQGVENVTFLKGDVYSLPFEDATFDVIHTHQAVCHFSKHVAAIKELIRVTKQGGMICMREGDIHSARMYPNNPVLDAFWQLIIDIGHANGTETAAGMKLKHWTVQAGIPRENITATAGTWCYNTPEGRAGM